MVKSRPPRLKLSEVLTQKNALLTEDKGSMKNSTQTTSDFTIVGDIRPSGGRRCSGALRAEA